MGNIKKFESRIKTFESFAKGKSKEDMSKSKLNFVLSRFDDLHRYFKMEHKKNAGSLGEFLDGGKIEMLHGLTINDFYDMAEQIGYSEYWQSWITSVNSEYKKAVPEDVPLSDKEKLYDFPIDISSKTAKLIDSINYRLGTYYK